MLTVLRMVLVPGPTIPETDRGCGNAVVGAGVEGGRKEVDGARRPLLGVLLAEREGATMPPAAFRVFPTGKAGRAEVGGPLAALGRVVVDIVDARRACVRAAAVTLTKMVRRLHSIDASSIVQCTGDRVH